MDDGAATTEDGGDTMSASATVPGVGYSRKPWGHGKLRVSSDGRYLEHADGTPMVWIGDTAWELFYRLKSSSSDGHDIEEYFKNRADRGFSVIQAVLMDEIDYKLGKGCAENGSMPLISRNPDSPVEAYWQWVDHVVVRAEVHGLYLCMLPCWGNWVNDEAIFDAANAGSFGRFLGNRYRDNPNVGQKAIWSSMANAIKGADGDHVMTFHPAGATSSSQTFHTDAWLDFNSYQSGHSSFDEKNVYDLAILDLEKMPAKPTLNSEPAYEGIQIRFWEQSTNQRFTDYEVRKDAYRALFAGSFGYTYGHSSIWQMLRPDDDPIASANPSVMWYDAIHWAGSAHMQHVGNLLRSRPGRGWRDATLVSADLGSGASRMEASRGSSYAFVFFPTSMTRTINLAKISGSQVRCYWYDTRNGGSELIGTYANTGSRSFTTPGGYDWVLVIDDAAAKFAAPGLTSALTANVESTSRSG